MRVKGNVKVDWYKEDEMLEDAGHVVIVDDEDGETFTLALEGASVKDSGLYKCVGTNQAGTVTSTATLRVVSEKPEEKFSLKKPNEIIKPQQLEEVNTQPTLDDSKTINLTIDSDSMVVTLPDEKTVIQEKQPEIAVKPTTADLQPTTSEQEQKPTSPKEKRTTPQKAPKVTPQKSPEDKTPKKPKTAEPTKSQLEPGKEIGLTIDNESGVFAAPQVLPEQEIEKPESKKPKVAEKVKPAKKEAKPEKEEFKPLEEEIGFTIDQDSVLMASPGNASEQIIPKEATEKKPKVAEKTKPKIEKPFEPTEKEMRFTIDTEAGLMSSPDNPPEQESKKPKRQKPEVVPKSKLGKEKTKEFEAVGKEMRFTIDSEAGLMSSPDYPPEQESKKPKSQKPEVAPKSKPGKEKTEEFEPVGKEIGFTIDNESLVLSSPEARPEPQIKQQPKDQKPKGGEKKQEKGQSKPMDKDIVFKIDSESLSLAETHPKETKRPKGQAPQVVEKPRQSKAFETVGKPVSLTIDDGSMIMMLPEEKPNQKTTAPPAMKKPMKDKVPQPAEKVQTPKPKKEQPGNKTVPAQKQPKDIPPKVAPKTTKDKTQQSKEKAVKPKRDEQPTDKTHPVEKQPKDTAPLMAAETAGKPMELRLDGGTLKLTLPTEDIIIPQDESSELFIAPESESDEITLLPEEEIQPSKDKPLSSSPEVKTKPTKPAPDSTEDDTRKLPYTTKREDGLPAWARRPLKPTKDEAPSAKQPRNKPDKQDVKANKTERKQDKPVEEVPKPIEVEAGQNVQVLLGPDQGVPVIKLKAKDQPELKLKQAEVKAKVPEVKSKPPVVKPKQQPEVKPKKSDKGKTPGVEKSGVKTHEVQEDESGKPAEQVGFVFKIDTSGVEAVKPEEKPKEVRKPYESIQDKKDKLRGKPEKNVPEWAKKARSKDTPPPVKPKTKPKSTDTRKVPGEKEIAPELKKDVGEPGVELKEGEDAQLKVKFKGTPPENVEWFKDGSKLADKQRFTSKNVGDGCELVVRKVTPRDSGTYICVATNETGSTTKTFHLIVEGKL